MRKRLVPLVLAALAGLSVVTAPELALAQQSQPSEQDIAQARQLGGQAQTAHDAGNFAEAEKLWSAARNLYPVAPTLSLGLARTQAKLGKYVQAQENYNRIIREWSNNPSPPPAFAAALEAARAEVGAMSAKVANVVITVEGAKDPKVSIDGNPVPVVALGLKRPVDPGEHKVHAEAPGYMPADATFSVTEGGNAEAKLKLEKDPNAVAAAPAGATPAAGNPGDPNGGSMSADTNKGGGKTLAIVALGVGGVGLVAGAITGLIAMGKASDLDGKCPEGKCDSTRDPNIQSDVDSYKTMGLISTIGFAVGVVGVGAGVVLWVTAPKESAAAKGSRYATVPVKSKPGYRPDGVKVTPVIGLGSLGLSGTF
jgi:hypothetical protein